MPRHCRECDIDLPDMVTVGTHRAGVKYCPFCGTDVKTAGIDG